MEDDMVDEDVSLREARNTMIHIQNLVEGLQAELKILTKKQEKYGKRYFVNSVLGYIFLMAVAVSALYYVFSFKLEAVKDDLEESRKKAAALEEGIERLQQAQAKKEDAAAAAVRIYALVSEKKDLEKAAAMYRKLDRSSLDKAAWRMLKDMALEVFEQEGKDSFQRGRSELWKGRYEQSLPLFDRALALAPKADFSAEAHWRRGFALYRVGRIKQAIKDFEEVLNLDTGSEFAPDAAYYKAYCLEMLGEKAKAVEAYKSFLSAYPSSGDKSSLARRKIEQLGGAKKAEAAASPPARRGQDKPRKSDKPKKADKKKDKQQDGSPAPAGPDKKPPPATPENLTPPAE